MSKTSELCPQCGIELPPTGWWWYDGKRICPRCAERVRREMLAPFEEQEKKHRKQSPEERQKKRRKAALTFALVCLFLFSAAFIVWAAAPKSCAEVERFKVHGYCPEDMSPAEEDACWERLRVERWMETECWPSEPYSQMFWTLVIAGILFLVVSYVFLLMSIRRRTTVTTWDWRDSERWGYEPRAGQDPDRGGGV